MIMMIVKFRNSVIIGLPMATSHIPAWLVHSLFFVIFCLCIFTFCTGCYVFLVFSLLAVDIRSVFRLGRKKVVQHWPCFVRKA